MKKLIVSSVLAAALGAPFMAKADLMSTVYDITYSGTNAFYQWDLNSPTPPPNNTSTGEWFGKGTFSFDLDLDASNPDLFSATNPLNYTYNATFWMGTEDNYNVNNPILEFNIVDWVNVAIINDFTLVSEAESATDEKAYFKNPIPGENAFSVLYDVNNMAASPQISQNTILLNHQVSSVSGGVRNYAFDLMFLGLDYDTSFTEGAGQYTMTKRASNTNPPAPTAPVDVPEPSSIALMLAGLALIMSRFKKA